MSNKCQKCGLVNFPSAEICGRCKSRLAESVNIRSNGPFSKFKILKRVGIFVFASLFALGGFYISLLVSAKPITYDQRKFVDQAVAVLDEKGFSKETWYLK